MIVNQPTVLTLPPLVTPVRLEVYQTLTLRFYLFIASSRPFGHFYSVALLSVVLSGVRLRLSGFLRCSAPSLVLVQHSALYIQVRVCSLLYVFNLCSK